MSTTPRPQLDAPVARFRLISAEGGTPFEVDDLLDAGPAVLAMVDGGGTDDARAAMLRELGQRIADGEAAARLLLVSPGDSALGRQLSVVRVAEWMTDPKGDAARALGLLTARKLRRDRRSDGLFVVDRERILRFAFCAEQPDQWVPASFVWSRLVRLGSAEPAPVQYAPEPGSPGEAELDVLVRDVGRALGLSPNELTQLATACRFRDLGMSVVPDEIITKIGPLSDDEWAIVHQHPERSAEMLGPSPLFASVREIVKASHEHVDGSGYPNGLHGDEIPLGARILLAAEAYLAVKGGRSYHDAESTNDPLAELRAGVGSRYDGRVVEALAGVVSAAPAAHAPAA
jgi:HD domain-containing protein